MVKATYIKPNNPSGNPNFVKGKSGHPEGRPKGGKNRKTVLGEELMEFAFNGLGGKEAFLSWCKKNPDIYYTEYIKRIPKAIDIKGDFTFRWAEDGNGANDNAPV